MSTSLTRGPLSASAAWPLTPFISSAKPATLAPRRLPRRAARTPSPARPRPLINPLSWALATAFAAAAGHAWAGPQAGQVAAGQAKITSGAGLTTVTQSTSQAVINWASFSVRPGETVQFVQPSAQASVLNRVTGADPSELLGRVSANGRVFLLNPNGIVFGAGSRFDAAALVASTSRLSDSDFMAGHLQFVASDRAPAAVINRGEINVANGGAVALVAPAVVNTGSIRADLGRVALAAGERFTVDLHGDRLVSVAVDSRQLQGLRDEAGQPLAAHVVQAGQVRADGGQVQLSAEGVRQVLNQAINLSGTVLARGFEQRGGEIVLHGGTGSVQVSGALDASSAQARGPGGRVAVTGGDVLLAAGSRLDASGGSAGGQVRVGGEFRGGLGLDAANTTRVEAGALLSANAAGAGPAGSVVVWSREGTDFAGTLQARSASGAGGQAEVSSLGRLRYAGEAELSGGAGRGGHLLLDPATLDVDAAAALRMSRLLRAGVSVSAEASERLSVNAAIDGRGGVSGAGLSLQSGGLLEINADLYTQDGPVRLSSGSGGIRMAATGGGALPETLVQAGTAAISFTSRGGDITAQHLVSGGAVTLQTVGTGHIELKQDLGGAKGLGSLSVAASGNARLLKVKTAGDLSATSGANGEVYVGGALDAGGRLSLGAAGGKVLLRHNVKASGDISFAGDVYVRPNDEILVDLGATKAGETEVNGCGPSDCLSFVTDASGTAASKFDAFMLGRNPRGGSAAQGGWDPVAMRLTMESATGSIEFKRGLLWDGVTGDIRTAADADLVKFRYFSGQPFPADQAGDVAGQKASAVRQAATPLPTRYYVVDLKTSAGQGAVFSGSGLIGGDPAIFSNDVVFADNPGTGASAIWCTPNVTFTLTASSPMTVTGTDYAGAIAASAISGKTIVSTMGNGGPGNRVKEPVTLARFGIKDGTYTDLGSFTVPAATAPLASAVAFRLDDVALPPDRLPLGGLDLAVAQTQAPLGSADAGAAAPPMGASVADGGDSPAEVADLGRGGRAGDPFALGLRLIAVGSGGAARSALAGNPYFSLGLFDYAASRRGR